MARTASHASGVIVAVVIFRGENQWTSVRGGYVVGGTITFSEHRGAGSWGGLDDHRHGMLRRQRNLFFYPRGSKMA